MKVCIVDSRVDHAFSVQDGVTVVLLDYEHDSFESLLPKIGSVESIAYVAHGTFGPTYSFFKGSSFDMLVKADWQPFFDFLSAVNADYFDFLGCSLASDDRWKQVFLWMEETGVKVRASTDATGNLASGGNWILEEGSVDAKAMYFTNLDSFEGLLATGDPTPITASYTENSITADWTSVPSTTYSLNVYKELMTESFDNGTVTNFTHTVYTNSTGVDITPQPAATYSTGITIDTVPSGQAYSSSSATNNTSNMYSTLSPSLTVSNRAVRLVSNTIDTSRYNNSELSFKLGSFSTTTGNGADAGDYVKVYISVDNGASYINQIWIDGGSNGTSQSKWPMNALGVASRVYSTTAITGISSIGNSTGPSTVKITNLPSSSTLKVKIELFNSTSANEIWAIDDIKVIWGYANAYTSSGPQTISGLLPSTQYYYYINYLYNSITTATAVASITTQAPTVAIINLTIDGISIVNKVYDGTTAATITGTAVLNGVTEEHNVSLVSTGVAEFGTSAVGTNKSVTILGYTLTGTDASKYSLTQPSLIGNITAAPLIIKANDISVPLGTAIGSYTYTVYGLKGADILTGTVLYASNGTPYTDSIGTYYITPSGPSDITNTNYSITFQDGIIRVAPLAPNATSPAITTTGFTANWTNPANITECQLDVYNNNDTVIASESFDNSMTLFGSTGIVTYSNTNGSLPNSPQYVTGYGLTVTNGTVVLESTPINTSGYTENTVTFRLGAFGANLDGLEASDSVFVHISPDNGSTYFLTAKIVGFNNSYWGISDTLESSIQYTGTNTTSTIGPTNALISDKTNQGFSKIKITNVPSSSQLKVKITLFNTSVNETWAMDDFKITGKQFVINSQSVSQTSYDVSGLSEETLYYYRLRSVFTGPPLIVSANSTTYSVTTGSSKTALTVTVTISDKEYDGTTSATIANAVLNGVIGSDDVSLVTTNVTATFGTSAVDTGKSVTVSGYSLTGTDASKYILTQPIVTGTITVATLTIKANDISVPLGSTPTYTYTASGFKNNETSSILTGIVSYTSSYTDSLGTYPITPSYNSTLSNYTITFQDGTLTVAPLAPTGISTSEITSTGFTANWTNHSEVTNCKLDVYNNVVFVTESFNNSTGIFQYSGNGNTTAAYKTGTAYSSSTVSNMYGETSPGFSITSTSTSVSLGTLTTTIDTSSYKNSELSFKLGSFGTSSGNGATVSVPS